MVYGIGTAKEYVDPLLILKALRAIGHEPVYTHYHSRVPLSESPVYLTETEGFPAFVFLKYTEEKTSEEQAQILSTTLQGIEDSVEPEDEEIIINP